MAELSNIELLEKYFNYELNDAEDKLFKTKLVTDEVFKEEYEIALMLRAKELEKRKKIYRQKSSIETSLIGKKVWLKRYLPLIAAAVVFLFIGINFLLQKESTYTENYLANLINTENAKPISVERGGNFRSSLYGEAVKAFNNKDFAVATSKFVELNKNAILSDEQNYYYGQSLWYEKKYKQAIDQFEKIDSSSGFSNDAKWFIALCHIKLKQYDRAKPILEMVLNKNYRNKKDQEFIKAMLEKI